MVSPNDHVVMNHQNQTPNKWHMRPCSLQRAPCRRSSLLHGFTVGAWSSTHRPLVCTHRDSPPPVSSLAHRRNQCSRTEARGAEEVGAAMAATGRRRGRHGCSWEEEEGRHGLLRLGRASFWISVVPPFLMEAWSPVSSRAESAATAGAREEEGPPALARRRSLPSALARRSRPLGACKQEGRNGERVSAV
jgi:hypothetical protein